ncbi:response regulator [Geomesophilobacter sediminis]|uniref:Response regulator n=1 Tax=Geomesophilobacter sediminis TaxID=2798584 RepID=A0A8J7S6M0_9BACT|nr:response regulator [Geomesophilobacter sediminis]MBJ6726491.1 response regulator [Geomesophilobacter sediminis]
MIECDEREFWVMGLGANVERGAIICSYLAEGGHRCRTAKLPELGTCTPRAILLDISPYSDDGWGMLLEIKKNPQTRDIPVLPVYLSEAGQVGVVFPVAGFFTLPIENAYVNKKLTNLGLTDESEDYDLQVMLVTRRGEEPLQKVLEKTGFEIVNAYTGKEAIAVGTTVHPYMVFSSLMLPDMASFELLERLRLYPQTRNIPFFVLLKDTMEEGEKQAMSRAIDHLVRKNWLTRAEFLAFFKKSA